MKFTSIAKNKTSNYQIDYSGSINQIIPQFEKYCIDTNAIWASLFIESDGELVASYSKEVGLTAKDISND